MYRILVADDEPAIRMLVAGSLDCCNFNIIEVDNGIDAWAIVKSEKPDLAILDVMMPGITGYELCSQIKTDPDLATVKVIILTARGCQKEKKQMKGILADFYISKPFSPGDLLSKVKGILGDIKK